MRPSTLPGRWARCVLGHCSTDESWTLSLGPGSEFRLSAGVLSTTTVAGSNHLLLNVRVVFNVSANLLRVVVVHRTSFVHEEGLFDDGCDHVGHHIKEERRLHGDLLVPSFEFNWFWRCVLFLQFGLRGLFTRLVRIYKQTVIYLLVVNRPVVNVSGHGRLSNSTRSC